MSSDRPPMTAPLVALLLAGALALAMWADAVCRPAVALVSAPGPASMAELVVLGAAGATLALGLWLLLGVALELAALLPGRLGAAAASASRAVTPAIVRRVVAVSLGVGLSTGVAPLASAAPPGPATDGALGRSAGHPVLVTSGATPQAGPQAGPGRAEEWPDPGFRPHASSSSPSPSPRSSAPAPSPTPSPDPSTTPSAYPSPTAQPGPTTSLPTSGPTTRPTTSPTAPAGAGPTGTGSTPGTSGPAATAAAPEPGWTPERPTSREVPDTWMIGGMAGRIGVGAAPSRRAEVVVLRGDSLWSIAARDLGPGAADAEIAEAWPRWWAANRAVVGPDPDRLLPGQVLTHPAVVEEADR